MEDRLIHCDRCGGDYEEIGFRKNHATYAPIAKSYLQPVCILCEQTERDDRKQANRAKSKARDTLRRHSTKFIKQGFAATQLEFATRYGWNLDRMVHDLEHTYDNWCAGCSGVFKQMKHGLSDITLDICDVRSAPYYASNTRWICQTCNRQKGRIPPDKWGARVAYNHQWRKQQKHISSNLLTATPLFHWAAIKQPKLVDLELGLVDGR